MPEPTSRGGDMVLAPNQFGFIFDASKGHVTTYVGPTKVSLSDTDRAVVYAAKSGRFEQVDIGRAIQEFPSAVEGWYVVLENPAREADNAHPKPGSNNLPQLKYGRKVNIPGPDSFPLWPGQVAHVIQGHHLRSNQYLVACVYNEEAAMAEWTKSVMKPQLTSASGEKSAGEKSGETGEGEASGRVSPSVPLVTETPNLTMGKLLVIKGTDVSFYMPPTGIEVVPETPGGNDYMRDAVTLERLEYCILLDESGDKRFVEGPDVVFPKPTEKFVVDENGSRKFRAVELNEDMGIYVKVIADYEDETGDHKVGEELFITGKNQKIYFPRAEHAIVKYGDREIHYAVAIPAGEARYVLNKQTGKVEPVKGPKMFLPDPRKEVIVRRVLDQKMVNLWFPGNTEALEYNKRLAALAESEKAGEFVTESAYRSSAESRLTGSKGLGAETRGLMSENLQRKTLYTPPRTITLDTKYDGAVSINVWTGYAALVVGKSGERKVVVGPKTIILEYDETLEVLELSTGTPKSDERLAKTVYLRVQNNKVSDIVTAETGDLVKVNVHLSYRVNFEDDQNKWFNVENYVKLLTDHMRSMIRNAVKRHGIEEFNANSTDIVRDTALGLPTEGAPRRGRVFEENGMRIYDVEVLEVKIGDEQIGKLLTAAQHDVVRRTIELAQQERDLRMARRKEEIAREIAELKSSTAVMQLDLQIDETEKKLEVDLAKIAADAQAAEKRLTAERAKQEGLTEIHGAELARDKAKTDQELAEAKAKLEQQIEELVAEVDAVVKKAGAITPDLISALQAFSDRALAEKVAGAMSPMALLGGKSVAEVFNQLLKGTMLANVFNGGGVPARELQER